MNGIRFAGEVAAPPLAEDLARIRIDEIFVVLEGRPISRRYRENGSPPGMERQGHVMHVHPWNLLLEPFPKNQRRERLRPQSGRGHVHAVVKESIISS